MLERAEAIKAFTNAGYLVETTKVMKNGVEKVALVVKDPGSGIAPMIYNEHLEECESFEQLLNLVGSAIVKFSGKDVWKDLANPEYVKEHIYICIQRKGNGKDVLSKPYLDLEMILLVVFNDTEEAMESVKVTNEMLERIGMTPDEVWEYGRNNTRKKLGLFSFPGYPYVIVTDEDCKGGAAALCFPDLFREYCEWAGVDHCYIIPSSVHELLIIKQEFEMDLFSSGEDSNINNIIKEVNSNLISDDEVLSNHTYKYDLETNTIS